MVSRDMFDPPLSLNRKLTVVAIRSFDKAHSLDLFKRKGSYRLLFVAHQAQAPNATTIREGDVFAIRIRFPSRRFVLDRTVVVLKARIAFLGGIVVLAVLIEAGDGRPGSISRNLTSLGVEQGCERVLPGQHRTVALQVIFGDTMLIHPLAQALVADELHNANRFINGLIVLLISVQFVFVDEHPFCLSIRGSAE